MSLSFPSANPLSIRWPINAGSDRHFDPILIRLQAAGIPYGNDPREPANLRTDHPFGWRGLFFLEPNGHLFEVMTRRELRWGE